MPKRSKVSREREGTARKVIWTDVAEVERVHAVKRKVLVAARLCAVVDFVGLALALLGAFWLGYG